MAYKWLAERKAQAMKEKLTKRGLPSYQQLPISQRYGVSFTGYGGNGRLDQGAPAEIDVSTGEPIVLHEGETKAVTPEGTLVIDANVTKAAGLTPEEERVNQMYNSNGNLPGMMCGGVVKRRYTGGFSPALAGSIRPLADATAMKVDESMQGYQAGGFAPQVPTAQMPTMPITPTLPFQKTNQNQGFVGKVKTAVTGAAEKAAAAVPTTPPTVPTVAPEAPKVQITAPPQIQVRPTLAGQAPQPTVPAAPTVPVVTPPPVQFRPPAEVVPEEAVVPEQTAEEKARSEAMDYLVRSLTAEDSPLSAEGRRATSELALRQQQERSALGQQLIQQGADPGRARIEMNMLRDKQEGELNDLAAQYGIALAKEKIGIAERLAPEALTGMRFEEEKRLTELQNKLNQATLLLSAGGEANIRQAGQIYNEAYPGLDIDFTKVITADRAASFNNGLTALSSYVQAGLDYGEALDAMRRDGTFEMLGLPEGQVEQLYNAINVNVIDEQWNAIAESDWYKNLPESTKQDIQSFFTAVLSGEVDYDIKYAVKDQTGRTMKTFDKQDDAAAFAAANPGYTVSSIITPVTIGEEAATTTEGGTTGGEIPVEEVPENLTEGDYFLKGGYIYKVGTDGSGLRATVIPDNLTGDDARAIIAAGKEGNPLYQPLLDAIGEEAKAGTIAWGDVEGLEVDDPIYQAVLRYAEEVDYNTLWGKEGDLYKNKLVKINLGGKEYLVRYTGSWNSTSTQRVLYSLKGGPEVIRNLGLQFYTPDGKGIRWFADGKYYEISGRLYKADGTEVFKE